MRAVFFLGMPGSGKSAVSRQVSHLIGRFFQSGHVMWSPITLEMSSVIAEFLDTRGRAGLPIQMDLESEDLRQFLWSCISGVPLAVISGVREKHLLTPSYEGDIHVDVISLMCNADLRRERYDARPENKYTFAESEQRAIDMRVPDLLEQYPMFHNEGVELRELSKNIFRYLISEWTTQSETY